MNEGVGLQVGVSDRVAKLQSIVLKIQLETRKLLKISILF